MTVTVANDEAAAAARPPRIFQTRGYGLGADVSGPRHSCDHGDRARDLSRLRRFPTRKPARTRVDVRRSGWQNYSRVVSNRENWNAALSTIHLSWSPFPSSSRFGLGLALLLNRRLPESGP